MSGPGRFAGGSTARRPATRECSMLDLPIDRLAERNVYRASLLQLQQSQRSFETLKDGVAVDARNLRCGTCPAQTSLRSTIPRSMWRTGAAGASALELLRQGDAMSLNLPCCGRRISRHSGAAILRWTLRIDPSAEGWACTDAHQRRRIGRSSSNRKAPG